MKILFGISSNEVVDSICQIYKEKYKDNLEKESAYYFKSVIETLKNGKYERLVINEDLEPFATNNYETIDKYLFSQIDAITDEFEAKNIIYISSERRTYSDPYILKLFSLGIYSVLIGQERTKQNVSLYINSPRQKKDVKQYIESVNNKNVYSGAEVSEIEIQRIQSYYQKLGSNKDKYADTFAKIANQYTNDQLLVIIKFLSEDVKNVLKDTSDKYKELLKLSETITIQQQAQTANQSVVQDLNQAIVQDIPQQKGNFEIKKQPEIVERIVIRPQATTKAPIMKEVIEKEVIRDVFEVPKDYKKVACFVGAAKTGNTFIINSLARFFASRGIKTAIIDMTKKKEHYYIYSEDKETKREIAAESLKYASNNMYEPLVIGNISVFTSIPYEDRKMYKASAIIDVAKQRNGVILIDCDFSTPLEYYKLAQEIYLIQDMDVLNIHQNTMFLRELKAREMSMDKVKVVINKHVNTKLTARSVLEGLSLYSNPEMTMIDEIFNVEAMKYFILPFEAENYVKYVDMLFLYKDFSATFTRSFKDNLHILANSVYPTGVAPKIQPAPMRKTNDGGFLNVVKNLFGSKKGDKSDIKFEKIIQ